MSLLILGCFLDTSVIILLTTPILLPIANAAGISPLVLGIIMVINTSVGMITPPMAVNLYIASRVSGSRIENICKKIVPFLIVEIIFVILISNFPQIITWYAGADWVTMKACRETGQKDSGKEGEEKRR